MNILLVALNAKYIHSNLAVHSIKGYCGNDGVRVLECTINQEEDAVLYEIYQNAADVVVFSCYIWNIEKVLLLTRHLKKLRPDTTIGLGGPEVSFDPQNLLGLHSHIDFILSGEGEKPVKAIMEGRKLLSVPGVTCRGPEGIITNPTEAYMDLDEIPFVYHDGNMALFENRILYYETSRGCPFGCSYCISSLDRRVRFLSLERVYQDIKYFLDRKVKQVKLVDRTFNCQEERARKIWDYMIRHDNGITNFHFEINALTLQDESIAVLKKARTGLFQLEVGVQSTAADTLKAIDRPGDVRTIFSKVKEIAQAGNIHQHLDLIAGLPLENISLFRQSFNEVYAVKPHQLQLGFLKVLKGSPLYQQADQYGIVYRHNAPYEVLYTKDMSYETLCALKNIERLVERYYNGGLIQCSLNYGVSRFASPFAFYEGFANHWIGKGYFQFQHNKLEYYRIFFEFMAAENLVDALFLELLKYDMLVNDNFKRQIPFLQFYEDKQWQRQCQELATEKWPQVDKSFHKMSRIEFFTWNVLQYETSGEIKEETIPLLFDYQNRDRLTNKATVYQIM